MSYRSDQITDALQVHDRECCTADKPCGTRTRLTEASGLGARVVCDNTVQLPTGDGTGRSTTSSQQRNQATDKLYGVCCRCGRTLTDENSISEGIGPICATKGF